MRAAARLALALAVLAAALPAAGCGSTAAIVGGGSVAGTTRTVYSVLPNPGRGAGRDMVLGQKLALQEAGGTAGGYPVSFVSLDESAPDPAALSARAGVIAEQAIHDIGTIAIFGGVSSEAAMTSIPLIDAAGLLHLLPGAGYTGFTRAGVAPGEPARWFPSGHPEHLVRLVGDDRDQARALVAAAARAARRGRARVAVEHEPNTASEALAAEIEAAARAAGLRPVASAAGADVVVYAGEDPVNAAGVAESVAAAVKPIVLPDALVLAGVADRLSPAARRHAVLVSSAPAPGSAPVRALTPAFEATFGRPPGPYAVIGYEAMKSLLAAMDAAGRHELRKFVVDKFVPPPRRGFSAYRADGRALR
jgi:ABC-type branched-subunit amino acid transport system substrate-binding protein